MAFLRCAGLEDLWTAPWGIGFKLGYDDDTGPHQALGCLSWNNNDNGFLLQGGPYQAYNCASYHNGRRGYFVTDIQPNEIRNSYAFDNARETEVPEPSTSSHNSWDSDSGFTVSAEDFLSLDDTPALGPRAANGSLPAADFLRLTEDSDLIDAGEDVGLEFNGSASDIGCFEH